MRLSFAIKILLYAFIGFWSSDYLHGRAKIIYKNGATPMKIMVYNHLTDKYARLTLHQNNKLASFWCVVPYYVKMATSKDSIMVLVDDQSQIEATTDNKGKISLFGNDHFFSLIQKNSPKYLLWEKLHTLTKKSLYRPGRGEIIALKKEGGEQFPEFYHLTSRFISGISILTLPKHICEYLLTEKTDQLSPQEKAEFENILSMFESTKSQARLGNQKYDLLEKSLTSAQISALRMNDDKILHLVDSLDKDGALSIHPHQKELKEVRELIMKEKNALQLFKKLASESSGEVMAVDAIQKNKDLSAIEKTLITEKVLYNNILNLVRKYAPDENIGIMMMDIKNETTKRLSNWNDDYLSFHLFNIKNAISDWDTITLQNMAKEFRSLPGLPADISNKIMQESASIRSKMLASTSDYTIQEDAKATGTDILRKIHENNKGKVVYIDMWATWCGPCKQEFKSSKPMKTHFHDKDVVFVYLCGGRCKRTEMEREIIKYDISGEHYLLTDQQVKDIFAVFKTNYYPTYKIMDKEGNILPELGQRPSQLEALILQMEPLLKSK